MYKFVIKEIKDGEAVLIDSKLEFNLPMQLLPKDLKAGQTVTLTFLPLENDREKKEKTAKEILNEILNS
jgi:hypothetical protein